MEVQIDYISCLCPVQCHKRIVSSANNLIIASDNGDLYSKSVVYMIHGNCMQT